MRLDSEDKCLGILKIMKHSCLTSSERTLGVGCEVKHGVLAISGMFSCNGAHCIEDFSCECVSI